ncbi:MAG: hypothetical protein K9M98_12470 [Cephaloticoccus sp.]|nr:hypothetical protein [Cephaloticoccus sp.]MCF7761308.1 hypothetical protein [Cephaloticoccus sp.]
MQPIPELEQWAATLQSIATQPLEYCPDFPAICQRFDAWWNQSCLDRPVFICAANSNPSRNITKRLELLESPEEWFETKLTDLRQMHRVGDTLPMVRPDFGPVVLSGAFGGKVEFVADTTWTHAFINDDWSNAPGWSLDQNNPWWAKIVRFSKLVASQGKGKYVFQTPNLGSSADILLNLRGSTELCMDVVDQPGQITAAVDAIYPAWRDATRQLLDLALAAGVGVTHHTMTWSGLPHTPLECDFNYMIGQKDFERLFLPDIARQSATLDRCVFHLDGPGAVKHLDALLSVPSIQAIQYVPGEGTPSALPWIDLYRRIQAAGKSVQIVCPAAEVLQLCRELKPEGVCYFASTPLPPDQLDQLFSEFQRQF